MSVNRDDDDAYLYWSILHTVTVHHDHYLLKMLLPLLYQHCWPSIPIPREHAFQPSCVTISQLYDSTF